MNNWRDKRGRVRVTVNGVRVEINRNNEVRVYRRYAAGRNTERRSYVLNGDTELQSLQNAVQEARLRLRGW
jgi:hypothetical protein